MILNGMIHDTIDECVVQAKHHQRKGVVPFSQKQNEREVKWMRERRRGGSGRRAKPELRVGSHDQGSRRICRYRRLKVNPTTFLFVQTNKTHRI
jgi:hypothetical protein